MAAYNFRIPNITGNDREQLAQIRSYLYQFIPQLQWALNNIDASSASGNVVQQVQRVKVDTGTGTASVNAEATFNAIKHLIITSADIVGAYYDEISNRLEGLYVAESDFGTYVEETDSKITANSNSIEQAYTNIQTINADLSERIDYAVGDLADAVSEIDGVERELKNEKDKLGDLEERVISVNARIRTGLLYYADSDGNETSDIESGTPVYGVEVGQTNQDESGNKVFSKYARFVSNRLSFYDDNDVEVAWISDYKLHIRNAEIVEGLKIGGFRIDTENGLAFKWEGIV